MMYITTIWKSSMKKLLVVFLSIIFLQALSVYALAQNKDEVMTRVDLANKRYNELFNRETSSLKETDPDLYEVFKNFVYGDVSKVGDLTEKERELITLVVLTVNQQPEILEKHVNAALNIGLTPVEIKEAVYQTAPYAGIPKAVIGLETVNKVFKKRDIQIPIESQATVSEDTRYDKGLETQIKLFGEQISKMRSSSPKGQEHICDFLAGYCFGDFYTRKGLDLKTRELLTLCMLTALGDTESQIKGHIQGNLNIGNTKETMLAAITQCLPYVGFPRTLNAIKYLNEAVTK